MKKTIIFFFISMFAITSNSDASTSPGGFHSYKKTNYHIKKQVPYDFLPTSLNILAIGDSLTKGVGDSSKRGGYIPYLLSHLELERGVKEVGITNLGVRGTKSEDLLKQLKEEKLETTLKEVDMVIITIGGNDIMKVVKDNLSHLEKDDFSQARKDYEKNLTQVLQTINDNNPNISVVLLGLYNPFYAWFSEVKELDLILEEWNETAKTIVDSYQNSYYVEIDEIFKERTDNLLYKDYFHPNDLGYSLIAEQLHKIISKDTMKELTKRRYLASKEENHK